MSSPAEVSSRPRWRRWLPLDTLAVAVLAFVPFLLTKPHQLVDDTKIYLYLDPGRLLKTAASMWSRNFAFGTVTHQNIGYLFPMGPFFWLVKYLTIPMWIGQRIWLGSLLLLAALGVRKCAQELGLARWAGWLAAVPYMLSPYILVNIDRTSALLLPWSGLGWMMLFTIRAARRGGWRYPALFAIVVAAVGGVNATSIIMVAFAPIAYLLSAAYTGEITWRRCLATATKIGVLSLLVSVWWIAGLWAEDKFGINVLTYTESFQTVTLTSTSSEVLRGLGYWYFYGQDGLQSWTISALQYMRSHIVPIMSFIAPVLGFVLALCFRWRYRLFAALTAFVGFIVAVSAYPLNSPTPIGFVFKWLTDHTTVAFALRSSARVVPIVVFGLALLGAAGLQALHARRPKLAWVGGAGLLGCACLGLLPLFNGTVIGTNQTLTYPLPKYVYKVAKVLDREPPRSNLLGLPGLDFAYYRFGTSNDSIWPGITHRPWISDQVQPEGEPSSIVLTKGLDAPIQDGIADPASIAPIARLLNAGEILVQMNTQYERYSTPLPSYMWNLLNPVPSGLSLVGTYGPRTSFHAINGPYIDEQVLSLPIGYTFPRSLAVYKVAHTRPLARTESSASPMIVAGNGEGLVTMASDGLLNNDRTIYFDASTSRRTERRLAKEKGAWLVLTDSNQRRQDEFGTLNSTQGYVLTRHEPLSSASNEEVLTEFSHPPKGSQTVALMRGLASVEASSYGNPITNNPEVQPYKAVDGNLKTAWQTSAFSMASGQWIQLRARHSHAIHRINLVQAKTSRQNRWINEVGIQVDGGRTYDRRLGTSSLRAAGQTVTIPTTRGTTVRITILGTTSAPNSPLAISSAVGFAEIRIPGFGPVTRGLLLPTSLLSNVGKAAATDKLSIVLNRARASAFPVRQDPELALLRYVDLPDARTFTISGKANLNPAVDATQLNQLLGRTGGSGVTVVGANDSATMVGAPDASAWSAFDGSTSTAWSPPFVTGVGEWVQETLSAPITLTKFNLTIVNDGYRAVPTSVMVSNGQQTETFPVAARLARPDGTLGREETFPISIPPLTGTTFRYTIVHAKWVGEVDRVSGGTNFPPPTIAEIDIPGVTPGVTPATFTTGCRSDLIKVDGVPVPVEVTGPTSSAIALDELTVTPCSTTKIAMHAGVNTITSTLGYSTGININTLVLTSTGTNHGPVATIGDIHARWRGQTEVTARVPAAMAGRVVVLAQSYAKGWHAILDGRDLGTPVLVDGASMGWRLPPHMSGTESLIFTWEPQKTIERALLLSLAAVVACCALAVLDTRRRRSRRAAFAVTAANTTPEWTLPDSTIRSSHWAVYAAAIAGALAVSLYLLPVTVAAAWLWIRRRRLGLILSGAATLLVGAGAVLTAVDALRGWPPDINWPGRVDYANSLVWIAIALWVLVIVATTHDRPDHAVPLAPVPGTPSEWTGLEPPTPSEPAFEVGELSPPLQRRRGLNVPEPATPVESEAEENAIAWVMPTSGWRRTMFLLRSRRLIREDPARYRRILTLDTVGQIVGRTALYNRAVLELAEPSESLAEELTERGARVSTIHHRPEDGRIRSARLAVPDGRFDVILATDALSETDDPKGLLEEFVRVLHPGGTLYLRERGGQGGPGGRMTARRLARLARSHRELAVFLAAPELLGPKWSWLARLPVLGSDVEGRLVIVAERRP